MLNPYHWAAGSVVALVPSVKMAFQRDRSDGLPVKMFGFLYPPPVYFGLTRSDPLRVVPPSGFQFLTSGKNHPATGAVPPPEQASASSLRSTSIATLDVDDRSTRPKPTTSPALV